MSGRGGSTADYDFELPAALIAQFPAARRDESRLLVVDRATGELTHKLFRDLLGLIPSGDTIVLNTSRVIKARLLGKRATGGEAEVLLLAHLDDGTWEAMVRPGAKLKDGSHVEIASSVSVGMISTRANGVRVVRIESDLGDDVVLERFGHVPLPPYIDRSDSTDDVDRYQTVYARDPGSVAAPTAGLHFTTALLDALASKGVRRADVSLHVGAGTFKPVDGDDPAAHTMHEEQYVFSREAAELLNATRDSGAHVWAVGTTSLRVLETVADSRGRFGARSGSTNIFIRPPHVVRGADRLITNFHLPRSTLLMLVSAFAGYDLARHVYDVAIADGYRFYSYGDALCVI